MFDFPWTVLYTMLATCTYASVGNDTCTCVLWQCYEGGRGEGRHRGNSRQRHGACFLYLSAQTDREMSRGGLESKGRDVPSLGRGAEVGKVVVIEQVSNALCLVESEGVVLLGKRGLQLHKAVC